MRKDWKMRSFLKLAVSLLAAGMLAACAAPKIVKTSGPFWPAAPQKPMISFVTGLRSKQDLPRHISSWERFKQAAVGERDIAILFRPTGCALSAGGKRLYVTDWVRGYVIVFDFQHETTSTIGAPGSSKPLVRPMSVALDRDENVYVVDGGPNLVRVYDKNGKWLRDIQPLPPVAEPFIRPVGIAIDKTRGLVYVSDPAMPDSVKHRIYVFNEAGKFIRYIGTRGNKDGQFNFPTGLWVDGNGMLYVVDSMNFRIQIFNPRGKFVAKFGQEGDAPGYFDKINAVATDGFGNIYVTDGGASGVTIFNSKYQPLLWFGGLSAKPGYFSIPLGITVDPRTEKIYVADSINARVNVYKLLQTSEAQSFEDIQKTKTAKAPGT